MSKHTPGPWKICETPEELYVYINKNGGSTAVVADCNSVPALTEKETLANARLIASAPVMLEEIHRALANLEIGEKRGETSQWAIYAMAALRTAIAKAEGRE